MLVNYDGILVNMVQHALEAKQPANALGSRPNRDGLLLVDDWSILVRDDPWLIVSRAFCLTCCRRGDGESTVVSGCLTSGSSPGDVCNLEQPLNKIAER